MPCIVGFLESNFQVTPGRSIIEGIVVTQKRTTDADAVKFILRNRMEDVRVPHEIDIMSRNDHFVHAMFAMKLSRQLKKLVIAFDEILQARIVLESVTRDLPQEIDKPSMSHAVSVIPD